MARKSGVKPTHYPILPFYILRTAQFVSSLIVGTIMAYFLHELAQDGFGPPWTFILLLAASLLTIVAFIVTLVLRLTAGISPVQTPFANLCLDAVLLLLWAVSFALLSWWSSGTLRHFCNRANWEDNTGVSICRTYKALFSFALLGLVATLAVLVLDVRAQKSAASRGKFTRVAMGLDEMDKGGVGPAEHSVEGPESNPNPVAARRAGGQRGGEGYALPEEQFAYQEDMAYHGAGGQVGRRSVEERI